jgi:plastocyanin
MRGTSLKSHAYQIGRTVALAAGLLALGGAPGVVAASGVPNSTGHGVGRAVAAEQAGEQAGASLQAAVTVEDRLFAPTEMTIPAGTTVTWANRGRVPHTTTSPGVWDSGRIAPGASWALRFDTPGTFDYLCTLHPNEMRARIVVEAAETATPAPPSPALATDDTRGTGPGFAGVGAVNTGFGGVGSTAGVGLATARLAAQRDSGVTGEARLLQAGPTTTLTISLEGLAPNTAHAGHVHEGACDGRVLYPLATITADATGRR